MKKVFFSFLMVAAVITGCQKNGIPVTENPAGVVVLYGQAQYDESTLTEPRMIYTDKGVTSANMTGGSAADGATGFYTGTTYFGSGAVTAAWETTDRIEFCFIQGSTVLTAISSSLTPTSGNQCNFAVTVPTGINTANNYTIYAITGSSAITYLGTNTKLATLPFNTTKFKPSLQDANIKPSIIQRAQYSVTGGTTPKLALQFKPIGSLLAFGIKITGDDVDFNSLRVSSAGGANWLYDLTSSGIKFDVQNNVVSGGSATSSLVFFNTVSANILNGKTISLYQWFIPTTTAPGAMTITLIRNKFTSDNGFVTKTMTVAAGDQPNSQNAALNRGLRYYINRTLTANNATSGPLEGTGTLTR